MELIKIEKCIFRAAAEYLRENYFKFGFSKITFKKREIFIYIAIKAIIIN